MAWTGSQHVEYTRIKKSAKKMLATITPTSGNDDPHIITTAIQEGRVNPRVVPVAVSPWEL